MYHLKKRYSIFLDFTFVGRKQSFLVSLDSVKFPCEKEMDGGFVTIGEK